MVGLDITIKVCLVVSYGACGTIPLLIVNAENEIVLQQIMEGMVIDTLLYLFMHVGDSKTCAANAYHTGKSMDLVLTWMIFMIFPPRNNDKGPCNNCGRMVRNRQMRTAGPKAGGSP
ncbi:hypothetical protein TEA_006888 [Camellia sinensis var. sinensis]|uniref:Uncharacterized protein n=1 Tax=Camellia sinensis var. sinensis TaxID=542762 RepID=A0A4S4DCW2_CAMSN|nr:hypothetical protein TEA_006888 [Camellia sinensis var. sinensis]